MKTKIPADVQAQANEIITNFNSKYFKEIDGFGYYATYKSDCLYLKRKEKDLDGPIARLTYSGKMNGWEYAIFKWSSETYDADELFFPGAKHLDGTIEGALRASHVAYPIDYKPTENEIINFFEGLFKAKK